MRTLPIQGAGLEAIVRDTTGDDFSRGGDPAGLSGKIEALRGRLAEKETAAAALGAEVRALKKTIAEEIPGAEGSDLAIDTFIGRAREFNREGNLLDAFHLYRRILRLDPRHIDALYELATIYYSADLTGRAAECLRAIIEIDPSQTRAADSLAQLLKGT